MERPTSTFSPDPAPKEPISSELHELVYEVAIWFAGHQPYARLPRLELIEVVLPHVDLSVAKGYARGGFRLTLSKADGRGVGVKFDVKFAADYRWLE